MWKGAALVASLPWGATAQFMHDAPDFSVAGPYSQWTKNALHEAPGGKPAWQQVDAHEYRACQPLLAHEKKGLPGMHRADEIRTKEPVMTRTTSHGSCRVR